MYDDFRKAEPDTSICYDSYYKQVKSFNISYVKLGEEECEKCDMQEKHAAEFHGDEAGEYSAQNEYQSLYHDKVKIYITYFINCKICDELNLHLQKAKATREAYRRDGDREETEEEFTVSTDRQKVIMLSMIPWLKEVLFCPRLVVFPQTFAPVGEKKVKQKFVAFGTKKFLAVKQQTSLALFLNSSDLTETLSISPSMPIIVLPKIKICGSLPRWRARLTKLMALKELQYITLNQGILKASFGRKGDEKEQKRLEDFYEFVAVIEKVGKAIQLKFDDFFEIPCGMSSAEECSDKPRLEEITVLMLEEGSYRIHRKKNVTDETFKSANLLQKKIIKQSQGQDFNAHDLPRGVCRQKRQHNIETLSLYGEKSTYLLELVVC